MSERNTISATVTVFMSGFMDFIEPLKWFLLLGLMLILADFRISRAGRRSINKMVDYLCWILLAGAIGKAFGGPFDIPVLPAVILLVVCGLEINSVFMNYFEARGKKVKVNIFKYFAKKTDIIDVEEK